MKNLYEKLVEYSRGNHYPMHMPGHKRNTELMSMVNPYTIDITEINGFDNLHHPEEVIKELEIRVNSLYESEKTFLLVNGSTVGLLAAISAATKKGDKVLLSRNSHKAIYHGLVLKELDPVYIYPQKVQDTPIYGGISPENIEEMFIKHPDIKLVIITSPTFEGVVSDIKKIAEIVHKYHGLLLVDEAHGAHFGFHKHFPISSVKLGADFVIQSMHKTLPSFTQTAILHSNYQVRNAKLAEYLAIYESSSPSYLLLSSMDQCVQLLEERGIELFESYYLKLSHFYQSVKRLKHIRVINPEEVKVFNFDPSKIILSVEHSNISGTELKDILREKYDIELEMDSRYYALAMTSIADTTDGFLRFITALEEIDRSLVKVKKEECNYEFVLQHPEPVLKPSEAFEQEIVYSKLNQSAGKISGAFIGLYPPGIPILVPGERIESSMITYIEEAVRIGLTVTGLSGVFDDEIKVLC